MQTKTFFSLFLLILPFCLFAHSDQVAEYAVSEIPAPLKENAYAVLRLSEEKFYIQNPGKGYLEVKKVITILDANGKGHAAAHVWYDNKLIFGEILSGEVFDASGKRVSKLNRKDILDQSVSSSGTFVGDNRVQYAELKHDRYPYTIAYTYVQRFDGLFSFPSFAPLDQEKLSVQQASFELICDADYTPRYQLNNTDIKTASFTDSDGKSHLKWTLSNLSAIEREAYAPSFAQLVPSVRLAPTRFKIEGYEGSMDDWKVFGEFMYELNKDRDELPETLKTQVMQLTADAADEREKIDILYRFLQKNTRYVGIQLGIGGFQTFPAEYVHKNGYGDCKALSNYMKGMLNYLEIPSYLAVIYRGDNPPPISPDFVSNSFNHMILCVPMETDTVWLECTNNHSLPGYLDESTANRYAVLVTPQGGKLVRTPMRKPHQNARIRTGEIRLRADGHADLSSHQTYSGYLQDSWESVIGSLSLREQEEYLRKTIVPGSYDLTQFSMYRDSTSKEPVCITTYDLVVKNCASSSSNRLFLNPNVLSPKMPVPEKQADRTQSIHFDAPYTLTDSLHFILPKGYIIESLPNLPITIESDFGRYFSDIKILKEGEFIYIREVVLQSVDEPASAYETFREFFRQISKADKMQLVMTNKS